MKHAVEKWTSIVLAGAALILVAIILKRELRTNPTKPPDGYFEDWESMKPVGRSVGAPFARVSILEFSELECPYCKRFHESLKRLQDRYPDAVSYTFIHSPVDGHVQSLPAARAAECAYEQGRFVQLLDVVFRNQSKLGVISWVAFGDSAGIGDKQAFARCMNVAEIPPMVAAGAALAKRMKVAGTPTIFLNGWRINGAPPDSQMQRMVADLVDNRKPYKEFPERAIDARRNSISR